MNNQAVKFALWLSCLVLLLTLPTHGTTNTVLNNAYEQLQKQLHLQGQENNNPTQKKATPSSPTWLPITKSPTQLKEKIEKLQQKLAHIEQLDEPQYRKKHAGKNALALDALLDKLNESLQRWQKDIDQFERLLLRHAGERNQIQKLLNDVAQSKHKLEAAIDQESVSNQTENEPNRLDLLEKQLTERATLLPLSIKRYELALQLARLSLERGLQEKVILESLLDRRLRASRQSPKANKNSALQDQEKLQLLGVEDTLRASLTKTRQDVLVVRNLGFDLDQMKEVGDVSAVYDLLAHQQARLLKLDLQRLSGKMLSNQLKLQRTIVSEELRSLDLSLDTFNRRRQLEQRLSKLDSMIPLAVELLELENELVQRHKYLLAALEQRRMWLEVAPALTPTQLLLVVNDVKEQLQHLGQALNMGDYSSSKQQLIMLLLILALLLTYGLRVAQKKLIKRETKPGGYLSLAKLCQLIMLIVLGCAPLPLWLIFSGFAFDSTDQYADTLGQVLQNTAIFAWSWSVISAFGRSPIQQLLGVHQITHQHWHKQANVIGIMSVIGLLLAGFAQGWYTNPYDDRIAQITLLVCSLVQSLAEMRLISKLRPDFGHYSIKATLLLLFPLVSLLTVLLATLGYTLAAWTAFSHKQTLMLVCGGLILAYELSLYLLLARTRRITLQHALHERKQAVGSIGPEDALEMSRLRIGDLQLQSKRLLQLIMLAVFLGVVIWLGQAFGNLIEPLGKVRVWPFAQSNSGLSVALGSLAQAGVILLVTTLISRNLTGLLRLALPAKFLAQPASAYTLSRIGIYSVWASGSLLILNTLGISWEKLQWLIIAVSLGIGFGLQEIFANFFSGLVILLERPFRVGDAVTVGNVEGKVRQIHMRATVIEDFDRKELIVPNKTLVTGAVTNWSLSSNVLRVQLWFGVAHGSDNDQVVQLLMSAADSCPKVLGDPPPEVYFIDYTAHAERYELRIFVNHVDDRFPARNQVNTRVKQLFAEHHIIVAHPQQDIHLLTAPHYKEPPETAIASS